MSHLFYEGAKERLHGTADDIWEKLAGIHISYTVSSPAINSVCGLQACFVQVKWDKESTNSVNYLIKSAFEIDHTTGFLERSVLQDHHCVFGWFVATQ